MWPQYSLDVSNYQRELGDDFFTRWSREGFSGLIVQAVVGLDGRSYTSQQIRAARDHGWAVAAYIWCSQGDGINAWRFQQRAALLEPFIDHLSFIALDVEEAGLQPEDVDADLLRADFLKGDSPLYTGYWVFEQAGWLNETYWAERRLWDSNYDRLRSVDVGFRPYGGWHEAWMKQYTDDPLDLNVCRQ